MCSFHQVINIASTNKTKNRQQILGKFENIFLTTLTHRKSMSYDGYNRNLY